MNKELLLEIKQYIEEREVTVDGECGACRSLGELISDKDMPDLYYKVCNLI